MLQPYASPSHKGLITPAETPRREIGELLEASEDERTKDDPGRGGTALEAGPGASDPLNIDTTETSFNKDQSSLTALNIRGLVDLDSFFTLAISGAVVAIFVFGLMLQRRREYIVMRAQGLPSRGLQALVGSRRLSSAPVDSSPGSSSDSDSGCCWSTS
jgi:hypothetical protein